MRFSERHGYQKVRNKIQFESVDVSLRNGLWSLVQAHYWNDVRYSTGAFSAGRFLSGHGNVKFNSLCRALWFSFFKEPLDTLSNDWADIQARLRKEFFERPWHYVFDFIEFVATNYPDDEKAKNFRKNVNLLLEREMSAYRFVGVNISPMTSNEEISQVENAISSDDNAVSVHMNRALALLSDKKAPDFRNSIKESISAVERLAARVVREERGTLGKLTKKLQDAAGLHPALADAINKLYGYTSDENGVRHALSDTESVTFADAMFILVTCSALINYVEQKLGVAI